MKILCLSVAVISLVVSGCTPKLAQIPLGETENRWNNYLSGAYTEWEAPETLPPTYYGAETIKTQTPKFDTQPNEPVMKYKPMDDEIKLDPISKDSKKQPSLDDSNFAEEGNKKFQTYIIKKNDTLWKLSKKFYGTGQKWKVIQQANLDKTGNPKKLIIGAELRIPQQ